MGSWLKYLLCAVGLFGFQILLAQETQKLPKPNMVKVGLGLAFDTNVFFQGGYERRIFPRISAQVTGRFRIRRPIPNVNGHSSGYIAIAGIKYFLGSAQNPNPRRFYLMPLLRREQWRFDCEGFPRSCVRIERIDLGLGVGMQFELWRNLHLEGVLAPAILFHYLAQSFDQNGLLYEEDRRSFLPSGYAAIFIGYRF